MTTKTITVTEDAYDFIKRLKTEEESFSDLFLRLAKEKNPLERYFGVLKGSVKEAEDRLKKVRIETSESFGRRGKCIF